MIRLVRIDERLIHGQVALGWTSDVGANTIFIANDEAQKDKVKAMALNMAKPSGVKLYIRGVNKESGEIVKRFAKAQKSQVLILIRTVPDALKLVKFSGDAIKQINVGGLRFREGNKKLNNYISVSKEDINDINELLKMGVKLDFRMLPRDKKLTWNDLNK